MTYGFWKSTPFHNAKDKKTIRQSLSVQTTLPNLLCYDNDAINKQVATEKSNNMR